MPITTDAEGSEDVNDFLLRIREMGDQRDKEDEERTRKLEEEIIQGRRERQARRAGQVSCASPTKTLKVKFRANAINIQSARDPFPQQKTTPQMQARLAQHSQAKICRCRSLYHEHRLCNQCLLKSWTRMTLPQKRMVARLHLLSQILLKNLERFLNRRQSLKYWPLHLPVQHCRLRAPGPSPGSKDPHHADPQGRGLDPSQC